MLLGFSAHKEIAKEMNIKAKTVKCYQSQMCDKAKIPRGDTYCYKIRLLRLLWEDRYGSVPKNKSIDEEATTNCGIGSGRIEIGTDCREIEFNGTCC